MDCIVPTPVAAGDTLYCSYPFGLSVFACSLSKMAKGRADESPVVWSYDDEITTDVPSAVVVAGCFYFIAVKKKTLTCLGAATANCMLSTVMEPSALLRRTGGCRTRCYE
jgi:hypothetical protein